MAKFTITNGYGDEKAVEADTFQLTNGYFWFFNQVGETVLATSAEQVHTIERAK